MKSRVLSVMVLFCCAGSVVGQHGKSYRLTSPNGKIELRVEAGEHITWSAGMNGESIIAPSAIALHLQHEVLGEQVRVASAKEEAVDTRFAAFDYKKDSVTDRYHSLLLRCKGGYALLFRVYDDGIAYRFATSKKDSLVILSEDAEFNFTGDYPAYIAYSNDPHGHDKYQTSFENLYQHIPLSAFVKDTVAFAPVLVECPGNIKAVITEADLEEYPGMFLQGGPGHTLHGDFARFVLAEKDNPYNDAQSLVAQRAGYIAVTAGTRQFPWRVLVLSENDKDLLNNDMVYRLASPSRIDDVSWIKPGKAAWDWWNDWNLSHVNFKAGINTETYLYNIDFAAAHGLEYILLDAGWSDGKDLMKIIPSVDLQRIVDYGAKKNVGVWLWGGSLPMSRKMDEVLDKYSAMGIKGFKIDFMDRDDQKMVRFYYTLAKKAAAKKLMIDFHGAYKPTGLQRTYPNVLGFEGVRGLENAKWSPADMPPYDATIPFIRMLAGPMDYTPGAMKNASRENFRPIHSAPMSEGTRCHQMAMYIVYEAPIGMLADNATNYLREPECTSFIASVPTVFDETVALDGKAGEYAGIARRKNNEWFIGVLGDWNEHDLTIDFSFLGSGDYSMELFRDGINADKEATDYSREVTGIRSSSTLHIHLAKGGGWAARISRKP